MEKFFANTQQYIDRYKKHGAFLVSGNETINNVMTISWGFAGHCWNSEQFVVAVRESRHTYGLMEKHDEFTVCIPLTGMESELMKAGTLSGRDGNKWQMCGLQQAPGTAVATPAVQMEDGITIECKIVLKADMLKDMQDCDFMAPYYKDDERHRIYFGEIKAIY